VVSALGCSSLLFALSIFAFGPHWPPYVAGEAAFWSIVLVWSVLASRGKPVVPVRHTRLNVAELIAAIVFASTLVVSIFHFYWSSSNSPSGDWDAQAIWTLRARFLNRGLDGHWRDGFLTAIAWSLPDYPLMLPASIARLWWYARSEWLLVPIAVAALFKYATVGMLVGALMALGRRWEGLCAGAVVLASVGFNAWGAAQIADVPLAAFALASTVLLSRIVEEDSPVFYGRSAGLLTLCAGCAAWTKNEGLVFAIAVVGVLGILVVWRRRFAPRILLRAACGLLLPLVALYYFKHNIAPRNYLFDSSALAAASSRVWDLDRHVYILRSFGRELWAWNTSRPIGILPFVIVYAIAASAIRGVRPRQMLVAVPLAAMLGGYYASYVLTPLDLRWHIGTSLTRLLVQIFPALVYVSFAVPEREDARTDVVGADLLRSETGEVAP
jgi:hypothetical protein